MGADTPVPLKVIVSVLIAASEVIVTFPLTALATVGVNVTDISHCAPASNCVPQAFVCAKSPLALMSVMCSVALPLFDTVIFLTALVTPTVWLPNATVAALSFTSGAAIAVPVPSSAVASALEFETTFNDAVRSAATAGLNVTLIVQLAPAASVLPQVFVCGKSVELVPPIVMLLIVSTTDALVFLSVANCAALVVLMV